MHKQQQIRYTVLVTRLSRLAGIRFIKKIYHSQPLSVWLPLHFINLSYLPVLQTGVSSLLKCRHQTTSVHVIFGLPVGLKLSTSKSVIFSPSPCVLS